MQTKSNCETFVKIHSAAKTLFLVQFKMIPVLHKLLQCVSMLNKYVLLKIPHEN